MKRLLILAFGFVALTVLSGPVLSQRKGVEKGQATGNEAKQTGSVDKKAARGSDGAVYEHELTAKVTKIDAAARTFTVLIQSKSITFGAAKLSRLPAVGKMLDITYTWHPDKPPTAVSARESGSREATGEEKRQAGEKYSHCSDSPGHHHDPFVTLKLKGGCPWW